METVVCRWMLVALAGVVFSAFALALALTTDNRDFAARHTAAVRAVAL